eukprot:TRINITY_DN234374_c0_g1_i1.p1 TRINITY_DN234374_c0_g1~~TRINITY_DN234374_c0_g1_i1.p1  ORF type:complete len:326 (-),score=94.01 TRINITY_DN234374_c0_g1_i1:242-1174(-)
MRLIIQENEDKVADWVANYVKQRIIDFKPTAEKPFVIGLPTGGTPVRTYKRLVQFVKDGELSFKHVVSFNMDEYVGLDEAHPESYHSFMRENLFDHIDILPENVHILNGNAPDLSQECDQFEKNIHKFGGIELFLGGIGHDGHIAFNEPGSSLSSRTRIKTLAFDTIQANSRFFDNDMDKVPKMALTVGIGTIMDAREVLLLSTGSGKAMALYKMIEEGINHMWTCSMLQMHPRACVVCDEAATCELRAKTVRYFRGLMATHEHLINKPMKGHQSRQVSKTPTSQKMEQMLTATVEPEAEIEPASKKPRC